MGNDGIDTLMYGDIMKGRQPLPNTRDYFGATHNVCSRRLLGGIIQCRETSVRPLRACMHVNACPVYIS